MWLSRHGKEIERYRGPRRAGRKQIVVSRNGKLRTFRLCIRLHVWKRKLGTADKGLGRLGLLSTIVPGVTNSL